MENVVTRMFWDGEEYIPIQVTELENTKIEYMVRNNLNQNQVLTTKHLEIWRNNWDQRQKKLDSRKRFHEFSRVRHKELTSVENDKEEEEGMSQNVDYEKCFRVMNAYGRLAKSLPGYIIQDLRDCIERCQSYDNLEIFDRLMEVSGCSNEELDEFLTFATNIAQEIDLDFNLDEDSYSY